MDRTFLDKICHPHPLFRPDNRGAIKALFGPPKWRFAGSKRSPTTAGNTTRNAPKSEVIFTPEIHPKTETEITLGFAQKRDGITSKKDQYFSS